MPTVRLLSVYFSCCGLSTTSSHHAVYLEQWCMSRSWSDLYSQSLQSRHFFQVDQGQNNYIRVPPSNNPVTDVNSSDLTCNVNGLSGSSVETVTISPGTNITYGIFHHEMSFLVVKILSQASSGTSMTNAPAKMPYLLDTRGLYKCTLPKHPPQRHLSMDRVLSGLRSILLVFSMPPLRSGPLMLLIPMVVCNTWDRRVISYGCSRQTLCPNTLFPACRAISSPCWDRKSKTVSATKMPW